MGQRDCNGPVTSLKGYFYVSLPKSAAWAPKIDPLSIHESSLLSGASGMCPFGVLQTTSGNSAFLAQRNVKIKTASVIIINKQKHFLGGMRYYYEGPNYSCGQRLIF